MVDEYGGCGGYYGFVRWLTRARARRGIHYLRGA